MENNPTINKNLLLLLKLLMVFVVAVSAMLIFLTFYGYGRLNLKVPNDMTVSINGHLISNHQLKLRPGSYQVSITNPRTMPYQHVLSIGLFQTTILNPIFLTRSPDSIASYLIGGVNSFGAVQLSFSQWFDNNTWFASLVNPGGEGLAVHYSQTKNQWIVEYYTASGYPNNLSNLPSNVASYITQLEAKHGEG